MVLQLDQSLPSTSMLGSGSVWFALCLWTAIVCGYGFRPLCSKTSSGLSVERVVARVRNPPELRASCKNLARIGGLAGSEIETVKPTGGFPKAGPPSGSPTGQPACFKTPTTNIAKLYGSFVLPLT